MNREWILKMKSGKETIVKELNEDHISARHWSVGETRIVPRSVAEDGEHDIVDKDDVFKFVLTTPEGAYITHCRTFEDCTDLYKRYLRDPVVEIIERRNDEI